MSNEPDTVNSGALATIIVLVAFSTLAVALVVTALVRDETKRLEAEKGPTQRNEVEALWTMQEAKLNQAPTWVDREKGVTRIPIASAMQIVLEAVRANPLEMSPGSPPPEEEEAPAEGEAATTEGAAPDAEAEKAPVDPASEKKSAEPAPKAPLTPKAPAAPAPAPAAPAPAPGAPAP
jgi:hypothetical protein